MVDDQLTRLEAGRTGESRWPLRPSVPRVTLWALRPLLPPRARVALRSLWARWTGRPTRTDVDRDRPGGARTDAGRSGGEEASGPGESEPEGGEDVGELHS